MKQQISTLMDGELCDDDADSLLGKIKSDQSARQEWQTFHLIGDVLRQQEYIEKGMSNSFFERLHAEPTILAPQKKAENKAGFFAMSAVASIMAMVFLAWLFVQFDTAQPDVASQSMAQIPANLLLLPASASNEGVNDYLLAHHEFSPGTDVRGASSFIRTVSMRHTEAGQ